MVVMNEWKKKCVGLQRTWVSKHTVELVVGFYLLNPQTRLDPLRAEWRVGQRLIVYGRLYSRRVRSLDKTGMSVKLVCRMRWPTCPCLQGCYQVISAPASGFMKPSEGAWSATIRRLVTRRRFKWEKVFKSQVSTCQTWSTWIHPSSVPTVKHCKYDQCAKNIKRLLSSRCWQLQKRLLWT